MTPDQLATLHARAFPTNRSWSSGEFAALLESPFVFVSAQAHAFALGRVIADEAELLTLVTDPRHRRRGLARTCLTRYECEAKERGATASFLEVAADNSAALALYEIAGYETIARRAAYYEGQDGTRTDALVLRRRLSA